MFKLTPYFSRSFPAALDRAFAVVLALFASIGSAGYLAFGSTVAQQFTLDLKGGGATAACLAISVNVALGFGLFVASPCKLLEMAFVRPLEVVKRAASSTGLAALEFDLDDEDAVLGERNSTSSQPLVSLNSDGSHKPWPLLRLAVVASATGVAVFFPNFALVLSLIGCVCDMTICFILPAIMHMVVVKRVWTARSGDGYDMNIHKPYSGNGDYEEGERGLWKRSGTQLSLLVVVDIALIVVGIVGMVVGVRSALS